MLEVFVLCRREENCRLTIMWSESNWIILLAPTNWLILEFRKLTKKDVSYGKSEYEKEGKVYEETEISKMLSG